HIHGVVHDFGAAVVRHRADPSAVNSAVGRGSRAHARLDAVVQHVAATVVVAGVQQRVGGQHALLVRKVVGVDDVGGEVAVALAAPLVIQRGVHAAHVQRSLVDRAGVHRIDGAV